MNFFRASAISGAQTVLKLALGFASVKATAVFLGPSGLAMLGQFQAFMSLLTGTAALALSNTIVKNIAQDAAREDRKTAITSTGFKLSCVYAGAAGVIVAASSTWLASLVVHEEGLSLAFLVLAGTMLFSLWNTGLVAVQNGHGDMVTLALSNVGFSVVSFVLMYGLSASLGIRGGLIAAAAAPAGAFFVTLALSWRRAWFRRSMFSGPFDRASLSQFAHYGTMAATAAIAGPLTQLALREYVARQISWDAVGQWQALVRFSDAYLMVITSTLSVYYLPRLAATRDIAVVRRELRRGFIVVLPVVLAGASMVYVLRRRIVGVLFTDAFLPMVDLFAFQLVGDVLKLASWLLSYLFLARALTGLFVVTELGYNVVLIVLAVTLTGAFGIVGVTYAYAGSYLIYLIAVRSLLQIRGHI